MSARRGLQPAAGALLCLGTGTAVYVCADSNSVVRRRIRSKALGVRREVLLRVLTRRLAPLEELRNQQQQPVQKAALEAHHAATDSVLPYSESFPQVWDSRDMSGHLFVVTGADINMTAKATERLPRAILTSTEGCNERSLRPTELVVPHTCRLGTGFISSLVVDQLLVEEHGTFGLSNSTQDTNETEIVMKTSSRSSPGSFADSKQQQVQLHPSHATQHSVAEAAPSTPVVPRTTATSATDPRGATASSPRPLCTWRESMALRATGVLLDDAQLDQVTLWAVQEALVLASHPARDGVTTSSPAEKDASSQEQRQPVVSSPSTPTTIGGRGERVLGDAKSDGASADTSPRGWESSANAPGTPPAIEAPAATASTPPAFFLKLIEVAEEGAEGWGAGGAGEVTSSEPSLCHELVRWGWGLTKLGVANVIVR